MDRPYAEVSGSYVSNFEIHSDLTGFLYLSSKFVKFNTRAETLIGGIYLSIFSLYKI